MKKLFKYIGWTLGTILLIALIAATAFYFRYRNWIHFQDALNHNDIPAMQAVLETGYNINDRFMGLTHLTSSIDNKDIQLSSIEYIIQNGADINKAEKGKFYPIITAIFLKRPDIVELLIRYGAKTDVKLHSLNLAEISIAFKQPEIIKLLPPMPIRQNIKNNQIQSE